jgi:TonB family protein
MRNKWWIGILLALVAIPGHAQQDTHTADAHLPADQLAAKHISPPKVLDNVEAEFSDDARRRNIGGLCLVSMIVDVQGNPQNARIIHCTDPVFEESSLNAVKKYRFSPAVTQEGKPVSVMISVEVNYRLSRFTFEHHSGRTGISREVSAPIHYAFIPQQGDASDPDSDGAYPFTRTVTGPQVIKFSDEGYGRVAFIHEGSSVCDVMLTIGIKGKASDPQVTHCERPELERPAVESLLKSEYKPGFVNGKEVPMRASIHLEYGDSPAKSE